MPKEISLLELSSTAKNIDESFEKATSYIKDINSIIEKINNGIIMDGTIKKLEVYKNTIDELKKDNEKLFREIKTAPEEINKFQKKIDDSILEVKKNIEAAGLKFKSELSEISRQLESSTTEIIMAAKEIKAVDNERDKEVERPEQNYSATSDLPMELKYLRPTKNDYKILCTLYNESLAEPINIDNNVKWSFFDCINLAFFEGGLGYFQTQSLQRLICKMMNSNPKDLKKFLENILDEKRKYNDNGISDEEIPF